jgi:aminoglycoside phosphotransferase (APT) family kinase protein
MVMTAVRGRPMLAAYGLPRHTADPGRVAADFAAVADWLALLQRDTAGPRRALEMDGGVGERLRVRFAGDPGLAGDVERLDAVCARLRSSATPATAVHGDLWAGNVLLAGGAVTGVVDWEEGAAAGEPVRDLVRFALSYALYLDRRTRPGRRVPGHRGLRAGRWGAGIDYAVDGRGWFCDLFRQFLRDGLSRLGADPAVWRDAACAGVAEAAARADDGAFARRHLELFRRLTLRPRGEQSA